MVSKSQVTNEEVSSPKAVTMRNKIRLGADPEVFLINPDGKLVSGHDIVPGTKDKPERLERCSVQADGLALEFNVDPASSADEFYDNVRAAISEVKAKVVPRGYKIVAQPAAEFDPDYFRRLPISTKMLGCDPDYSAVDGKANRIPNNAQEKPFRTGSGHLHISWFDGEQNTDDVDHQWDCRQVVINTHHWFGILRFGWDKDTQRSKLYGLNGALRYKKYGVEYRAPSNAWLKYPALYKAIYQGIDATLEKMKNFGLFGTTIDPDYLCRERYEYISKRKTVMFSEYYNFPGVLDAFHKEFNNSRTDTSNEL